MKTVRQVLENLRRICEADDIPNFKADLSLYPGKSSDELADWLLNLQKDMPGWESRQLDKFVKLIHSHWFRKSYRNTENSLRMMTKEQIMHVYTYYRSDPNNFIS